MIQHATFIDVITATRDPDAPPLRTDRINFSNPVSRQWLQKHMTWAIMNGHSVHMAKVL